MADPNDVYINQRNTTLKQNLSGHMKVEISGPTQISDYEQFTLVVGAAEVPFPAATLSAVNEIIIQAASTNSASIVIGKTGILSNLSNGGFEMVPPSMIPLPTTDVTNLRAISSVAGQELLITYVKAGV